MVGSLEAWRLRSLDRPHATRLPQRITKRHTEARGDEPWGRVELRTPCFGRLGMQRRSRRPSRFICPIRPTAQHLGTSQTCRGCRGKWKLESLFILPTPHPSPRRGALCSLFSVAEEGLSLRACTLCSLGRVSALPLPGRGATPHTFQSANSANQLISRAFWRSARELRRRRGRGRGGEGGRR